MHMLHLYGILLRKTRILEKKSMKDKGQSTRDGGTGDVGREKEEQNTATEKEILVQ